MVGEWRCGYTKNRTRQRKPWMRISWYWNNKYHHLEVGR